MRRCACWAEGYCPGGVQVAGSSKIAGHSAAASPNAGHPCCQRSRLIAKLRQLLNYEMTVADRIALAVLLFSNACMT